MFYCNKCGIERNWPVEDPLFFRSYGRCEICHKTRDCSCVPSRLLGPQVDDHIIEKLEEEIERMKKEINRG